MWSLFRSLCLGRKVCWLRRTTLMVMIALCLAGGAKGQTWEPPPIFPNVVTQQELAPALRPEWPVEPVAPDEAPMVLADDVPSDDFEDRESERLPSRWRRFLQGAYECLTAFDPCYEPRWVHLANAALQVEPVRPQTQQRFRWDSGWNLVFPDRAEYFLARMGGGVGLAVAEPSLRYDELTMYTEAAHGGFGAFTILTYRSLDPASGVHYAGFGDMAVGTKSLLHDSELARLAFRFTTFIPSGNSTKGLGTGHLSMELALLFALHLTPSMYLQGEVGQWFPLGGDHAYAGALANYHFSLNRDLCRDGWCPWQWIVTWELSGWSFQDGAFTHPTLGPEQRANDTTYLDLGPGLRVVFHDHLDLGFGVRRAVTDGHWAETLFRTELRIRY